MIAYVTSIGEVTTDLCVWSLERNGFDVRLIQSATPLADKLKFIYNEAQSDFVRVDADVVPNRNLTPLYVKNSVSHHAWWVQYQTFQWFKQDLAWGGVQFIQKAAIKHLRHRIDDFLQSERPETAISRIEPFYHPRRFVSHKRLMGIQGFKAEDIERIKATKLRRSQQDDYDWDLAERLSQI